MKKVYIKPELRVLYNVECNLMGSSEPRSDEQLSKENEWEDFEGFQPLYDNSWGDTWKDEE